MSLYGITSSFPSTVTQSNYTDCQKRYLSASKNPGPGLYIPWCRPDGEYNWLQCYRSYCFCVNQNGKEIKRTRVHSNNGQPKCTAKGKSWTWFFCYISDIQERLAGFIFVLRFQRAVFCCSSVIWVSDIYKNFFGVGGELTPCQLNALEERTLPSLSSVTFTYRCKKDGSYEEVQCQNYGICWCVDENGKEVPGTQSNNGIRCPRRGEYRNN